MKNGGDIQEMENELDKMLKEIKEEDQTPLQDHAKYREMNEKIDTLINAGQYMKEDQSSLNHLNIGWG